jgi:hypothetical protein
MFFSEGQCPGCGTSLGKMPGPDGKPIGRYEVLNLTECTHCGASLEGKGPPAVGPGARHDEAADQDAR